MSSTLFSIFQEIDDPRVQGRTTYPLLEILFLCITAMLSGAEGWEAIEDFGVAKLDWLQQYLPYETGIPRHDTIARLISSLSSKALQTSFIKWMKSVVEITAGEVIAIDGKQSRGSHDRRSRKNALHLVSAFACANGVVLGQQKSSEKSNEITAIPKLLSLLELKGAIVTIDAMGCQRTIAEQIIEQEGDYVLAVKGNQGTLHEAIKKTFEQARAISFENMTYQQHSDVDKGHGRIEKRQCTVLPLMYLHQFKPKWKGLQSIVRIDSERLIGDRRQVEQRYYVSSLPLNASTLASAIRQHWSIENKLHWVLDVSFKEDSSRMRRDNAAHNLAIMRHLTLNLIKKEPSKMSVPRKRRMAVLHDDFRHQCVQALRF